jgi:hypothetical protein
VLPPGPSPAEYNSWVVVLVHSMQTKILSSVDNTNIILFI